jgi:hypothetical protein
MDNVRLRRLKADHEALRRLAHLHPKIEIEGVYGNPPERYRLLLKVGSLRERGEVIEVATQHRLEITMPRGYPRDAPLFRMLTPVFHPNIAPHAVCIGDDWTAGEPLDLLVQRVGEILAYQSYNIKSPLNGRAAQWVEQNPDKIPVDRAEFFLDLAAAPANSAELAVPACSNCGGRGGELTPCSAGHVLCGDCVMRCPAAGHVMCLKCGDKTCAVCRATQPACKNCGNPAPGALTCAEWHTLCGDCGAQCPTCRQVLCLVCGTYPCRTCAPGVQARPQ